MKKLLFVVISFFIIVSNIYAKANISFTQEELLWIEQHPVLKVGAEKNWAPFSFVDNNGNHIGLSKDYLNLIANYAGFKIEYQLGETWEQLLDYIKTGKIDILPALNINEERKKFINFSNPYLKLPEYYYTKYDYEDIHSLKQLNGKKVASVKKHALTSWLKKNYPKIIVIEKYSIQECLQSVQIGEAVTFISDNPSTSYILEKNFMTGIKLNNILKESTKKELHIGVKKGYEILVSIINKTLAQIPKEKISQISSKWMKTLEKSPIQLTALEKNWIENNPMPRIGVMTYWPHDKNGDSLHTEILKLINRYSGLNLIPIKYDVWDKGYSRAFNGDELHGIMGLSWSQDREKSFHYSTAYDFTPSYLITKRSNNDIKTFNDLKDKTLYLKSNSIINKMMQEQSPSTKIINIANTNKIYKELATTNDADAMLAYFIDEKKIEEYNLKIVETIYDRYGEVAIGINKNYNTLSSIINKTFKIIPKNELSSLRDKKWGENKEEYHLTQKEKAHLKKLKKLNICINPNWEPIEFLENGTPSGITMDIFKILKETLDIEYNFIKTESWIQSQQYLKDKKCDILPSAAKTQQRVKYANFTDSYLHYDLAIITTADKPLVKSMDLISSKTMSRKKGSGLISQLKKEYPYIEIKETQGLKESLQSVIDGKTYFTIATIPAFSYYKSKYGLKNLQIAGYTDLKFNLSVAVRDDDTTLLEIMNKVIKSIPRSTLNVLHDKWSTANVIKTTNWTLIFQISIVILLITIFLLWSNRKLKKTVEEKTAGLLKQKMELEDLSKNLEHKVELRTKELELSKQEIEEIHKQTRDSIEYAYLIQETLIPSNEMFDQYFKEHFTIWHPKDVVGGDIFLFEPLRDENECLLMVIDCTGHGVPGAFVSMLVKAIERQITSKIVNSNEIVSPAKILSIFNTSMKHLLKQDENNNSLSNAGFDGAILYYNKKEKIVKFSGAETPLFYFDKEGQLQTIKGSRHSVGYKKSLIGYRFKEHCIEVEDGMSFYLTTDGFIDQNGGNKSFPFGKKRFSNILKQNKDKKLSEQRNILLNQLDEYQGIENRNDDITLVGMKI